MSTYQELDLNARINLKGAIADWARYSVSHFQESLEKKVYQVRTGSRRGRPERRTGALKNHWYQSVQGGTSPHVLIEFMRYGRFLDMGVGRGTDYADRVTARRLRMGSPGRTPRRWYARRKGYELHRLRELLATKYVSVPVDLLENSLTLRLPISL